MLPQATGHYSLAQALKRHCRMTTGGKVIWLGGAFLLFKLMIWGENGSLLVGIF